MTDLSVLNPLGVKIISNLQTLDLELQTFVKMCISLHTCTTELMPSCQIYETIRDNLYKMPAIQLSNKF